MSIDRVFETVSAVLSPQFFASMPERASAFLEALHPYATVLSLLFLTGIVYCFLRYEQIVEETYHDDRKYLNRRDSLAAAGEDVTPLADSAAGRFEQIRARVHSEKESEWRLAVLEADVLLNEMVTGMGYRGDSLGEKLKGIEESDFLTRDKVWEAHAVRNKIAHEGAAFALTAREARRIISLYEEGFKEFRYI